MNILLKSLLTGFALPCLGAVGMPKKFKTERFKKETPAPLRFGSDGKFRILHLTDIHEVMPEMDDDEDKCIPLANDIETLNVIETLVEKTKPDLVVFGGDNVSGYWKEFDYELVRKTIQKITYSLRKRAFLFVSASAITMLRRAFTLNSR